MRIIAVLLISILTACATKSFTDDISRSQVLRDVEGYAIASCLAFQSNTYLKDQGDAWASVIIQRMKGSPDALAEIVEKVRYEIEQGNMAVIRDDVTPGQDKNLPVLFCGEIIDLPKVRSAIQKAIIVLEASYSLR